MVITAVTVIGVLTLALQNCRMERWLRIKSGLSLLLSVMGVLIFVVSLQSYAAIYLGLFLAIKVFLRIRG